MTAFFTILLKLLFVLILLLATVISAMTISPALLLGWMFELRKSQ